MYLIASYIGAFVSMFFYMAGYNALIRLGKQTQIMLMDLAGIGDVSGLSIQIIRPWHWHWVTRSTVFSVSSHEKLLVRSL